MPIWIKQSISIKNSILREEDWFEVEPSWVPTRSLRVEASSIGTNNRKALSTYFKYDVYNLALKH